MALYMIATIRRDFEEIIGLRLYDTKEKATKDFPIGGIIQSMRNKPDIDLIKNLGLDGTEVVGLNGKLDRYAKIIRGVGLAGGSTLVIVKQYANGDFEVVNGEGKSARMTEEELIKYSYTDGIANGAVVDGKYIRSISGEFEKEVVKDPEQLLKRAEAKLNLVQTEKYSITDGVFMCLDKELKKVVVPEGVHTIGTRAFSNMKNLEEVVLPKTLRKFGYKPFSRTSKLKVLNVPYGVESFDNIDLLGESSIEELHLPNTIKHIGMVLINATELKVVYYKKRELKGLIRVKPNVRVLMES